MDRRCRAAASAISPSVVAGWTAWLAWAAGLAWAAWLAGAQVSALSMRPAAGEIRSALRARDAGQVAVAEEQLSAAAAAHPVVADHIGVLRAEMWLAEEEPAAARDAVRAALARAPRSPLRAQLHRLEGRALLRLGNRRGARAALEQARAAARDAEVKGEIDLVLGELLEADGRPREAAQPYVSVWTRVASIELGERAEARLAPVEKALGGTLRSGRDWRRRGDGLVRWAYVEEGLAAYESALKRGLSASDRRRAERGRAEALFSLRRYPEAVDAFAKLSKSDANARIWHARALARAGDVDGAVERLERIAKSGPRSLRHSARYTAALLLEDDHPERARAHFEVLARNAHASLAADAHWNLGWADYQAGRFADARRRFAALAKKQDHALDRLRARYWEARALERDDASAATAALMRIADEYPFSYYGWRAAHSLPPVAGPPAPRRLPEEDGPALPAGAFERPEILVAAGLPEAARGELRRLSKRASRREDRLALARLYGDADDPNAAQVQVLRGFGTEELARGPLPGYEEAWWMAWPLAWEVAVQRWSATSGGSADPALVWAIMREESGYRPAVVSTAGARGLLQIMPETGERLAQDAGVPFAVGDLFVPEVNIRFGALYLGQLGSRFPGRASAAIGSYNAGPEAVSRWLEERPALSDDEFVESIPYSQTRRYVKRVLRSRHVYRVLY